MDDKGSQKKIRGSVRTNMRWQSTRYQTSKAPSNTTTQRIHILKTCDTKWAWIKEKDVHIHSIKQCPYNVKTNFRKRTKEQQTKWSILHKDSINKFGFLEICTKLCYKVSFNWALNNWASTFGKATQFSSVDRFISLWIGIHLIGPTFATTIILAPIL